MRLFAAISSLSRRDSPSARPIAPLPGAGATKVAAAVFDDGLQILDRLLEAIIDHGRNRIRSSGPGPRRRPQAALNDLIGIGAAPLEPLLQRMA